MLMKVVTVPDFCGRSRIRKFRVSRAHVQSEIDPDYFDPPYAILEFARQNDLRRAVFV